MVVVLIAIGYLLLHLLSLKKSKTSEYSPLNTNECTIYSSYLVLVIVMEVIVVAILSQVFWLVQTLDDKCVLVFVQTVVD